MDIEATPESAPESQLIIKDYSNWTVEDAQIDCASMGLSLGLPVQPPLQKELRAIVKENGDGSKPGTSIGPGGIVSVVIFPLEPRQG